jgi:hypothetical protein
VGLGDADHDIHPLVVLLPGGPQHTLGLAHPGAAAEEDLQAPAVLLLLLPLDLLQQGVGVWALVWHEDLRRGAPHIGSGYSARGRAGGALVGQAGAGAVVPLPTARDPGCGLPLREAQHAEPSKKKR